MMQKLRYWLTVAYPVEQDRGQHDELEHQLVDPRKVQRLRRSEEHLEVCELVLEVFGELLEAFLLDELGKDLGVGHEVDGQVWLSVGVVFDSAGVKRSYMSCCLFVNSSISEFKSVIFLLVKVGVKKRLYW
jgi:hypothetical protein